MKEAFGGFEVGLTEMYFPSPGLRHKHKLTVIWRQHYTVHVPHYIGCFFGENKFSYIGQSRNNLFDNLKYNTLVCKKNCNDVFFLLISYSQISTFKS